MSLHDRIEFMFISFIHDKMYSLFMDARKMLLAAGLKESYKVLEVGCGPGFFTLPAAEIVGDKGVIYANDFNPFAIKKVDKKILKSGVKNVQTMLEDVTETSLKEQSVNLAFFFGVIHSLMNILEKTLKEMYRILNDEGTIVIQKGKQSTTELIEKIEESGLFKFIEEKKRLLIFKKI